MKLYELSFCKNFRCLAGECPGNCCEGWMIPLTEEDCHRYASERGLFGLRLALAMTPGEQGREACFNESCGKCPFLNRYRLCKLQIQKGSAYIPEACRDYPRFYRNYRLFEDRCTDLSCIHSARLFLDAQDRLRAETREGEPGSRPCSTNDDGAYLQSLDRTRWEMIRMLGSVRTAEELSRALASLAGYADRAQEAFLAGETDFLEQSRFADFGEGAPPWPSFPFPAAVYRRLMNTAFYSPRLCFAIPKLYELCRLYFGEPGTSFRSQPEWEGLCRDFLGRCPELPRLLADYTAFYLFEHFLRAYEDYSFRRIVRIGIVHTNMVFLFSVLCERSRGELGREELAQILSVYGKRACYNDTVLSEMYRAAE